MGFLKKRFAWAALYAFLLISFTLYVALDTFVITRVYSVLPSEENVSNVASSPTESTENHIGQDDTSHFTELTVITENSYSDQNISITLTEYREYDTSIYVANVHVSSVEYLQTAFAQNSYGRNITEKTSAIAETNGAILAINGDFYGVHSRGYVLKNGKLYRKKSAEDQEDLVIWEDGSFEFITESTVSASSLLENGALHVLSFGPALVENGSVAVTEDDEVGKELASNPRTAIAIVDGLHFLFVVSDGRTNESEGLTLYQLAMFMQGLDADIAYNLDGGGSSTMVSNGEVINVPTSDGKNIKERRVSDIVYIGY